MAKVDKLFSTVFVQADDTVAEGLVQAGKIKTAGGNYFHPAVGELIRVWARFQKCPACKKHRSISTGLQPGGTLPARLPAALAAFGLLKKPLKRLFVTPIRHRAEARC
jgi:hypothetical protein